MVSVLKMVALVGSVVWILIVMLLAALIALFSDDPFFASPGNWLLILSPVVPLAAFYGLDRFLSDE